MKVLTLGLVLIVLFCLMASSYAQKWPTVDVILQKVQADLNLDQEQYNKVKVILEDNMSLRRQVLPQLSGGLTQAQAQPLDAKLYHELSGVLTQSQMTGWNKILRVILQDG